MLAASPGRWDRAWGGKHCFKPLRRASPAPAPSEPAQPRLSIPSCPQPTPPALIHGTNQQKSSWRLRHFTLSHNLCHQKLYGLGFFSS